MSNQPSARTSLRAGEYAPAFTLCGDQDARVTSASLLKHGPLVMLFYRGSWCPHCQAELAAVEAALPALHAAGARVIAVSPEIHPARAGRQLEMLSDPHNRVADLFGLTYALSIDATAAYQQAGKDLVVINGDDSWTLPLVARFVIAPDRLVLYSQVHADHTVRADPANVLPVLNAYRQRLAPDAGGRTSQSTE